MNTTHRASLKVRAIVAAVLSMGFTLGVAGQAKAADTTPTVTSVYIGTTADANGVGWVFYVRPTTTVGTVTCSRPGGQFPIGINEVVCTVNGDGAAKITQYTIEVRDPKAPFQTDAKASFQTNSITGTQIAQAAPTNIVSIGTVADNFGYGYVFYPTPLVVVGTTTCNAPFGRFTVGITDITCVNDDGKKNLTTTLYRITIRPAAVATPAS